MYGDDEDVYGEDPFPDPAMDHLNGHDKGLLNEPGGDDPRDGTVGHLVPLDNQRTLGRIEDYASDASYIDMHNPPRKNTRASFKPRKGKDPTKRPNTMLWDYITLDEIRERMNGKNEYETSCDELTDSDSEQDAITLDWGSDSSRSPYSTGEDTRATFHQNVVDMCTTEDVERAQKLKRRKMESCKNNASKCFGCLWHNNKSDAISGRCMNLLLNIIEENYGQISNEALARVAHLYFKHNIYLPMRNMGKRVPMWRSRHIKEHIEEHTWEPRFFIGKSISAYSNIMKALQDMIFRKVTDPNGNTTEVCDEKTLKLHLQCHKRISELYEFKSSRMNFYNEKLKVDMERIGSFINLNKSWAVN